MIRKPKNKKRLDILSHGLLSRVERSPIFAFDTAKKKLRFRLWVFIWTFSVLIQKRSKFQYRSELLEISTRCAMSANYNTQTQLESIANVADAFSHVTETTGEVGVVVLTTNIRNSNTSKICMGICEQSALAFQWPRSVRRRPAAQAVGPSACWDFRAGWTCAWPRTVATHPVIRSDRPFQSARGHSSAKNEKLRVNIVFVFDFWRSTVS